MRSLRSLFALNDGPWRWAIGRDAGLAMALPLLLFQVLGNFQHGMIASLGAFTALYAANQRRIDRAVVLPFVMLGIVCAACVGMLASSNATTSVVALVSITFIAGLVTIGLELGPPGPMFFVLVCGVSSYIAAGMRAANAQEVESIPILVAIGALIAYAVIVSPLLLPAVRRREGPASPLATLFPTFRLDRTARLILARISIAALLAAVLSTPLQTHRTYWIVITAMAILQASHVRRITWLRAAHRVSGTVIGIGVFALLTWLQPQGYVLILVIAGLQALIEVVVARNYGLALIFITPLALTIASVAHPLDTVTTASERVFDTLLGSVIALAVLWVSERLQGDLTPHR